MQGSITKTGNTHVRRLLVEAAWHHRPATSPARPCATGGNWPRQQPGPAATRQPATARTVGHVQPAPQTAGHRQRRHRPRTGRLVLVAGRHGVTDRHRTASSPRTVVAARGATRDRPMSSPTFGRRRSTLDTRMQLLPNTPSCGNQPAHISLTARRQRHAHHQNAATKHEAPPGSLPGGASPCPLTNLTTYQVSGPTLRHSGGAGRGPKCPVGRSLRGGTVYGTRSTVGGTVEIRDRINYTWLPARARNR